MTIEQLSAQCADETQRYYRNEDFDEAYCYELVRRAIVKHEAAAWEAVLSQYHRQFESWIRRACSLAITQEDIEDLFSEMTARIWRNYTAEVFGRSTCLAEVLRYWQDCARSTAFDWQRRQRKHRLTDSLEDERQVAQVTQAYVGHVDADAAQRLLRQSIWDAMRACCADDADQLVARRVFIEGMKPRQISAELAGADRSEVYRRVRRLKDCLRRDAGLREMLQDVAAFS